MFLLTTAYVQQAHREREVAADLHTRQLLRSSAHAVAPPEPPASSSRATRRPAVRVRAASR
jgi:hypothetical protein